MIDEERHHVIFAEAFLLLNLRLCFLDFLIINCPEIKDLPTIVVKNFFGYKELRDNLNICS